MISPRQALEDNIHPAELLLRVYRLLENDTVQTKGDLVKSLRSIVKADADEELMLIYNEIFLGLIRERAQIPASTLKRSGLCNLLRQAVVVACTALDAYLPAVLRLNLPIVIKAKGRDFFPQDEELRDYFKELTFDLAETLRLLGDPDAPLYIANKILGLTSFKYLSSRKGIHAVGSLLSLEKPWYLIAEKLQRDRKELMNIIDETTRRRNDIVHRADRLQADPGGEMQEISYAWAKQVVDTITHVCLALDELISMRMAQLRAEISRTTE
ncbi:hypothetical protein L0337_41570 [candidate division KSB1 bacterium]|nr:hypothetical protein [candidate division KSB1 bacterium]